MEIRDLCVADGVNVLLDALRPLFAEPRVRRIGDLLRRHKKFIRKEGESVHGALKRRQRLDRELRSEGFARMLLDPEPRGFDLVEAMRLSDREVQLLLVLQLHGRGRRPSYTLSAGRL